MFVDVSVRVSGLERKRWVLVYSITVSIHLKSWPCRLHAVLSNRVLDLSRTKMCKRTHNLFRLIC